MTQPSTPHFSIALDALAHLPVVEYDLLARELNVYAEAIRTRAGRTQFTAAEMQTLIMRMWDVARITPDKDREPLSTNPVNLDDLSEAMAKPGQITKRRTLDD